MPRLSEIDPTAALADLDTAAFLVAEDRRIVAANLAFRQLFDLGPGVAGLPCHRVLHGAEEECRGARGGCPVESCGAVGGTCRAVHLHALAMGPRAQEVSMEGVGRIGGRRVFLHRLRPARADAAIVGRSPALRRSRDLLERAARSGAPVLIRGEAGTGRALAARTLHDLGPRREGPFVPVLCAGLDEGTWSRDLFGFPDGDPEDGPAAAAPGHRPGLVDRAAAGTLFLDDVCTLPAGAQSALLRLLDTGRRPGPGVPGDAADLRLVSSCNGAVEARLGAGTLRQDLFFRLAVLTVTMPPLRELGDDVAPIARHLLRQIAPGRHLRLHPEALLALRRQPFPGNVRELRAVLEHAAVLAEGGVIRPGDLPESVLQPAGAA